MEHYIPLHVHDEDASIGDSILSLKAYVEEGAKRGLPALAITNHGSLASMYKFYELCKKHGIKSILGNEFYVTVDNADDLMRYIDADSNARKKLGFTPSAYSHCVIIAMNDAGFKNLLYLTSYSATKTFYKKPLLPEEVLFAHSEGLICLSACVGGVIPKMILANAPDAAIEQKINTYASVFKNRFFLELQPGNFKEQMRVNMRLAHYAKALGLPLVATNDIHYLEQSDAIVHNIHVAGFRGEQVSIEDQLIYRDDCYYFMKRDDVKLLGVDLATTEEALHNTQVVASMCETVCLLEKVQMPVYDPHLTQAQAKNLLVSIAIDKLMRITHTVKDPYVYTNRLLYEISVIEKLGFIDYFLIIWDVLQHARKNAIGVGVGRGSVCGSLLAYLLDIIAIDPIKYDLMFERFLSEHRTSVPDIDIDICSARRDELFTYVQNKYGYDHCAQVSTVGVRKAKSAIKDVARALGIKNNIEVGQAIADLIPTTYYDDNGEKETDLAIERSLEIVPELRAYQQQYPELFRMAIGLQNKPKNDSIHAAGILIFPQKLQDYLPLRLPKKSTLPATSLSLKYAENVAIKFDFLGIRTLDMCQAIEHAINYVVDIEDEVILSDPAVWHLLGSQYNAGLFQISSLTYKKRMYRLKPKTIEELAACLALVRGPCISSGLDEKYMRIVEGRENVQFVHPVYDKATSNTLGVMIYQEQSMHMFQNAGMSSERSFELMKLMSKKNVQKAEAYRLEFYDGCYKQNATKEQIDYMWHLVTESAKYSFNASHALAYALTCFKTAYYKAHYSQAFFAALLTHEFSSGENAKKQAMKISAILKEVKAYGYTIVLPDINTCHDAFVIKDSKRIMAGTCAIKGFGNGLELLQKYGTLTCIEDIFGERPAYIKGTTTQQACKEVWKTIPVASKTSVIAGIFAGLFDSLYKNTKKTRRAIYEDYLDACKLYSATKPNDINDEVIKITSHTSIKISQTNKQLEKAIYGVSFY